MTADQGLTLSIDVPVEPNDPQIVSSAPVAEVPAAPSVEAPQDVISLLRDDNLRKAGVAEKFSGKSVDDLFKSYMNLESLMGKKVSQYSADEAAQLRALQGIPQSADEYKLPEGLSEELAGWFKENAVKAGLSANGALELATAYMELEKANIEKQEIARREAHKANVEVLKKELGAAYESRISLANRAAQELGGNEAVQALLDAGLGAHPAILKMLSNVGKMMEEDSIPSSQHNAKFGVTPEDAKMQIQQLMSSRETLNAYYNKHDAKHELVKKQIQDLYAVAYPD